MFKNRYLPTILACLLCGAAVVMAVILPPAVAKESDKSLVGTIKHLPAESPLALPPTQLDIIDKLSLIASAGPSNLISLPISNEKEQEALSMIQSAAENLMDVGILPKKDYDYSAPSAYFALMLDNPSQSTVLWASILRDDEVFCTMWVDEQTGLALQSMFIDYSKVPFVETEVEDWLALWEDYLDIELAKLDPKYPTSLSTIELYESEEINWEPNPFFFATFTYNDKSATFPILFDANSYEFGYTPDVPMN